MSRKNHVDKIRATPGSTTKPSLAAKWATRPAFVNAPTSDVLRIAARERQYLGQDLHDQCGQELTALGILADALVVRLRAKLLPEVQLAKKIQALGRVLLHRVRKIARASVMPMSGADLPHALRRHDFQPVGGRQRGAARSPRELRRRFPRAFMPTICIASLRKLAPTVCVMARRARSKSSSSVRLPA